MRLPVYFMAAFAVIALPAAASAATQCKDAKGKFTKCPPTATASAKPAKTITTTKAKTTTKPATASKATTTKKTSKSSSGSMAGRCRDAKGRFAKCGTPGTHPA